MTKNWAEFLNDCINNYQKDLFRARDFVLSLANLNSDDILIDIGTGLGLLGFEAYKVLKDKGKVIAIDNCDDCINQCLKYAKENKIENNYEILKTDIMNNCLDDESANVIVSRSVIMHIKDKQAVIRELYRLLKKRGRISLFEAELYTSNERLYKFLDPQKITNFEKFKNIEELIRNDNDDPLTNYNCATLKEKLVRSGFVCVNSFIEREYNIFICKNKDFIEQYFLRDSLPLHISLKSKFLKYISEDEFNIYLEEVKDQIFNKPFYQYGDICYIVALKNPTWSDIIIFFIRNIKYKIFFYAIRFLTEFKFYRSWYYLKLFYK